MSDLGSWRKAVISAIATVVGVGLLVFGGGSALAQLPIPLPLPQDPHVPDPPVELPGGQSTIQILYNFQAMVNVASVVAGNPNLTIEGATIKRPSPDKPPQIAFTVHNSGKNYGYISNGSLTFVQRDASGKEVFRRKLDGSDIQQMIGFGLVGPETSRTFVAPIDLANAEGKVEVTMSTRGK